MFNVYQAPVNLKYKVFSDILFYNFDICFPNTMTTLDDDDRNPCITDEIRILKREIHELETKIERWY